MGAAFVVLINFSSEGVMAKEKETAKAAVATEDEPKPKHIKVKSTLPVKKDGGAQVALYETDPNHPNGEVFIAGEGTFEVAETSAVARAISEGRLVKV
jgi:hypothetical protein